MKPRFKLRLDGSLMPVCDPFTAAMRRVTTVSDAPIDRPHTGMTARDRQHDDLESRLRRRIARAYGTQAAFCAAAGIKQHQLHEALTRSNFPRAHMVPALLRSKLGLPVHVVTKRGVSA